MKSLEEYDTTDIADIIATNIVATVQLDKNADILTIICTCVFNTMIYCCTNDISDKAKVIEEIMKFTKKFEKTIEVLDENSCNDKEEK